jgi:hypothetical protein
MARQTRIKFAALATSLVAALGVVALSPATSAHAGGGHVTTNRTTDRIPCC